MEYVYLSEKRRIKIYKEGGLCQECLINGEWYISDDENWLNDVMLLVHKAQECLNRYA